MLKNNQFSIYFFFIIIICFIPTLHSMEQAIIIPEIDNRLEWQIALTHGVEWFDYKTIHSLGDVTQGHNEIVKDTVNCRKQYFMQKQPLLKEMKDLEWNMYGTVCAKISSGRHPEWSLCKGLRGPRRFARSSDKNYEVMIEKLVLSPPFFLWKYDSWNKFYGCLPHQPGAVVSLNGDVRFYAYGEMSVINAEKTGDVVEYCCCSDSASNYKCMTQIQGKQVPLMNFLEFPSLLKAFLNSSIIQFEVDTAYGSLHTVKVYSLDGVTIPDDYQEHKEYFSMMMYKSFKKLPKFIRKTIDTCYNMQHEKKAKKVGLLSCFG